MQGYSLVDGLILRTPYFSLNDLFDDFFGLDESSTLASLKKFYAMPVVQEAMFLSSPHLYEKTMAWLNGTYDASDEQKLIDSLAKYRIRMSARCTPFGLFAGFCRGDWSEKMDMVLGSNEANEFGLRPDIEFLVILNHWLRGHAEFQDQLDYFTNQTVYQQGEQFNYIEYSTFAGKRAYRISAVDYSPYLEIILKGAEKGAKLNDLADLIVDEDISKEEARAFLDEIVESQLLLCELEPAVVGDEYQNRIARVIEKLKLSPDHPSYPHLLNILEILKKINVLGKLPRKVEDYEKISQMVEELPFGLDTKRIYQLDLKKNIQEGHFSKSYAESISKANNFLRVVSPLGRSDELAQFINAFVDKYETEEVSLLQALDPELGIGYGQQFKKGGGTNSLLRDLAFGGKNQVMDVKLDPIDRFLLKRYNEAIKNDEYEVVFTDEDLPDYRRKDYDFAETIPLMAKLLQLPDANGPKAYIYSIGGATAARIMARFAHADEGIREIVDNISKVEAELNPNMAVAELAHLPHIRIGNMTQRPLTRDYEIPALTFSEQPAEKQIPLNDLYISVVNGYLVLRSKRLNKEVLPRLSNAHVYNSQTTPIYHFLGDLQKQQRAFAMGFSWGHVANTNRFFPRATYQDVVIYRATWYVNKTELPIAKIKDAVKLDQEIKAWREKNRVPRHVYVVRHDLELLLDLEQAICQRILRDELKKHRQTEIKECLQWPGKGPVRDEAGNTYANEILMAFAKDRPVEIPRFPLSKIRNIHPEVQRSFAPGSEWLYYKIYTGPGLADTIISQHLAPLQKLLEEKYGLDNWFFIRYADPDFHIRLRFRIKDEVLRSQVLILIEKILQPLVTQGTIWKLQLDSYRRELERYGGNTIELAEDLFRVDSQLCWQLIMALDEVDDLQSDARWQFALRVIDEYLDAFAYTLEGKLNLMSMLAKGFAAEFEATDKIARKQLADKYRANRQAVDLVIKKEWPSYNFENFIQGALPEIKTIADAILIFYRDEALQNNLNDVVASIIHMHVNRLFPSENRMVEMVLYDFMAQHYRSLKAQQKRQVIENRS